jgi:hypothetical protein
MKTHTKPFITLISGPILLCGLLCQTSQAADVTVTSGTATLADSLGDNTPPEALTVAYSVTEDTVSDIFTYTYTVNNPANDVVLAGPQAGQPEIVDAFIADFNDTAPGAVIAGSIVGGNGGFTLDGSGVEWAMVFPTVAPGTNSGPLSFESYDAPTMGNAAATDANPPSPWNSSPDGQPVPVPSTPDSTNTAALLAGMLLLLPLRSTMKKQACLSR